MDSETGLLCRRVQAPVTVPAGHRLLAFSSAGELTGVWLAGMECLESRDLLLLVRREEMELHYAILRLCRDREVRLNNVFDLGANARVRLRAGSGCRVFGLFRQAGMPEQLTLRDAYTVLQEEITDLYRCEARRLSGGKELPHSAWRDLLPALDEAVWPDLERRLWASGLIPCNTARIQNLTDLYVYRG